MYMPTADRAMWCFIAACTRICTCTLHCGQSYVVLDFLFQLAPNIWNSSDFTKEIVFHVKTQLFHFSWNWRLSTVSWSSLSSPGKVFVFLRLCFFLLFTAFPTSLHCNLGAASLLRVVKSHSLYSHTIKSSLHLPLEGVHQPRFLI